MAAFRGVLIGLCLCFFAIVLFFTVIGGVGVFGASAGRAFAEEIVEEAQVQGAKPGAGRDEVEARRRAAEHRRWARRSQAAVAPEGQRPVPDAEQGGGW